ncbi:MAG: polysaccharide biosynthesis/export family protein [Bacteroidota bacterium]
MQQQANLETSPPPTPPVYKIKALDNLMIKINAFDGSTQEFLNREFGVSEQANGQLNFNPESVYYVSYTVDAEGYLDLPIIGKFKANGLSTWELRDSLNVALKGHMELASTQVKLANLRVTVLGEVNNPGLQYMYNDKNNLLEMIGQAGDMTNFADRTRIQIIRQTETGTSSAYIDLSSPMALHSPYYYLMPGDVVYVEPIKPKAFDVSSTSLGVVFSAVTAATLIINLVLELRSNP